jgi:4-hydroxy-2-oxoheptanedioate aldolase
MQLKHNKFKQNIKSSQTQYGLWHGIVDSYASEIAAGAGFDWILVDEEHAPFDFRTILQTIQVMAVYETPVIVRPPYGDAHYIKQLVDGGVQTILVPMVESAEQAEHMAKAMLYPPAGIRGIGTALARAAQWNRVDNYFRDANEQMCLIVQVESITGVQNLDEILKVENLDGVFIGPSDLAASMGYLGQPNHPLVKEQILAAFAKIRAAGKTAGILAVTKPVADEYEAHGANMIAVGVDTLLLANATKALAESYKPTIKGTESNTKY